MAPDPVVPYQCPFCRHVVSGPSHIEDGQLWHSDCYWRQRAENAESALRGGSA